MEQNKLKSLPTYIEICAESTEDNWNFCLVSEQQDLGLAWVIVLEHVVVSTCDFESTVADMLERHLLKGVSVKFGFATLMVLGRHRERWVDAVSWEL